MAVSGVESTVTDMSATYTRKDVEATNSGYNYTRNDVQANNSTLEMDDFFQLLAAELRYQDMSDPMSNSEMMGQLTQMATMTNINSMSSAISAMSTTVENAMNSLAQISLSSYATNLLGQEVTVANTDENGELLGTTTGVVEGVSLTGGNPYIYVNGKEYSLSDLMAMGEVPDRGGSSEEDDTDTGEV